MLCKAVHNICSALFSYRIIRYEGASWTYDAPSLIIVVLTKLLLDRIAFVGLTLEVKRS